MIEDRRRSLLLCPVFVMIAVLLFSCDGDSGVGSSGWEENHGNAISETTHGEEMTRKPKAFEGDDAWYRQCLAEDISGTPSTRTAAPYGNETSVKMRRSSGGRQRYGTVMARDVYNDAVDGMRWAAAVPVTSALENRHPAKAVNLSVASVGACSWTFQHAIDDLVGQRVTVVAAASNDVVNEIDASSGYMHGTSLAAPQVSGLVSLMLTTNPWLTPGEVASILKRATRFSSIASEARACRVISPGRDILDATGCRIDCCSRAK